MIIMRKTLSFFLMLIITSNIVLAMSPDEATTFVTQTNNYLVDGETPVILTPIVTIEYSETDYWVVTGMSGSTVNIYLPINTDTREIASGEVEIRDLIKTAIVLNRIFELKNNFTAGDWPFSITNRTNFETMNSKFGEKIPSITTIETDFTKISDAENIVNEAKNVKKLLDELSTKSNNMKSIIEEGINFEKTFFTKPRTKDRGDYENIFSNYFNSLSDYKKDFEELKTSVNNLRNNIGSLQSDEINASQKEFYNNIAKLPNEIALLNNVFLRADETQTFTEQIFNSVINIENFVLNLNTRKQRNIAWKTIYGIDNDIKKVNNNINSLEEAAQTILSEKNIDYWKNQDSVNGLKINWKQAQEKYNNGLYNSAIEFAKTAKKNSIDILKEGFIENEEIQVDGLIINIIIVLIFLIIGIFLFEKFYLNKKKKEENGEEYYEPFEKEY